MTDDQTDDRTVAQTAAEGDARTPALARKDSGLFVEDSELLRRLGIPEKIGYRALAKVDRDVCSDFPHKNAFWRQRRYWPAVIDFLDATCRPKYLRATTIPDDIRQTVIRRARGFSD
jgi:hypothetical protein